MRLRRAVLSASLPLQADGRAQLLPASDFAARDGRPGPGKKWKLNPVRGAAIAAALSAVAAMTPVVIDYEHQTLHKEKNGQPAPAAGWIKGADWIDGEGLVARVDWTDRARASIQAREYLYISPVVEFDEDTGEVMGVALAALTNYPAIVGMPAVEAALSTQFHQEEPEMATLLASLIAALGLAATTTETEALTAVTALKAKADKAPEKTALSAALTTALGLAAGADETAALTAITTLKTATAGPDQVTLQTIQAMQGQIAALTAQLGEDKVTKAVDEALAAHKLLPAQRDWALALGKKDMAALTAFIASAPAIPGLGGQSNGNPPGGTGGGAAALTADAGKLMAGFGLTPEQWEKAKPATATA